MSRRIYIGLGTNAGNRRDNLELALRELRTLSVDQHIRVASVYETPALLPENAPATWNRPYWNTVAEIHAPLSARELLQALHSIESKLGRVREARWEPRTIDLDILLGDEIGVHDVDLQIPHSAIAQRGFVLSPLSELIPDWRLPSGETVRDAALRFPLTHTRLMGICNATPDSFSDGGKYVTAEAVIGELRKWDEAPVPILDLGGESTRPDSQPVTADEEWRRLEPILSAVSDHYAGKILRPRLSIDTIRAETAARAVHFGVSLINDVSGLADPAMPEFLRGFTGKYILMHSLSVPADPRITLPEGDSPLIEVSRWFTQRLEHLASAGFSPERCILDPGVGFGKRPLQSLEILRTIDRLKSFGLPILVGHSRKSFLSDFSPHPFAERDPETLGASLALAAKGIDLLRVHSPLLHHRALLAWRHAQ